jgi:hypothetical protein
MHSQKKRPCDFFESTTFTFFLDPNVLTLLCKNYQPKLSLARLKPYASFEPRSRWVDDLNTVPNS